MNCTWCNTTIDPAHRSVTIVMNGPNAPIDQIALCARCSSVAMHTLMHVHENFEIFEVLAEISSARMHRESTEKN